MFSANDMLMVKTIDDQGSLTAAAAALHTSQPALSRSLNNLETRIGARLFRRLPRGMTPTPTGQTLLQHAEQVQAITRAAQVQIEAQVRLDAPVLRLGIAPYISLAPITRTISAMEAKHPDLHFQISVGAPVNLTEKLSSGDLDLVIGPVHADEQHVKQTKLFEDNSVVIVRRAHPLRGLQPSLRTLSKYRWILPGQTDPLRKRIDALFAEAELPPPIVQIETEDIPLSFNLALRSDYLVAIPKDVALYARRDQDIRILKLELPSTYASIGVTQLRSRRLIPEAQILIDAMAVELARVGM
ncbi:MAG: LysR substrate-binding domain-containing protein [Pseudomonadota bacterium]